MNLTESLATLGDCADNIARSLREKGIRGRRSRVCLCPIAMYLVSCGFPNVAVSKEWATVYVDAPDDGGWMISEWALLPPAVADFVRLFDRSTYPLVLLEGLDHDWDTNENYNGSECRKCGIKLVRHPNFYSRAWFVRKDGTRFFHYGLCDS